MGQKTNPNILRLGKTKDWKSKYLEKKPTELSTYIFKDIEIQKFIFKFFENNGFNVKTCKLYHSETSLHIYIAYHNLISLNSLNEKTSLKTKTKFKTAKSKEFKSKNLRLTEKTLKSQFYTKKIYNKLFVTNHLLRKSYFLDQKTQKLKSAVMYQTYLDAKAHSTLNNKNKNLFIQKIIKGLNLFTTNKQSIYLNLKQLNKEKKLFSVFSKTKKQRIAKNLTKLRRFQQNEFLKKGINLLYNFMSNSQSTNLLAEFIALCLKKIKRPNVFLRFLKTVLKLFIYKEFSKFKRIQIKIKGRFNGMPRASSKTINIGKNIPVLTINSKIDYSNTTAYTSNGTFGIKVWAYTI